MLEEGRFGALNFRKQSEKLKLDILIALDRARQCGLNGTGIQHAIDRVVQMDFGEIRPSSSEVFGRISGHFSIKDPGNQRIRNRAFQNIQNYSNRASIGRVTLS